MKVLITGCDGQVGTELMCLAEDYGYSAIGVDRGQLDITDKDAVSAYVVQHEPDVLINAAAYTAVDKAESDVSLATAVNATGVAYLAQACVDLNIPFVHISTDYVFDGSQKAAYKESDVVSPLGVYGESKLAGENFVQDICDKYYIFRTSWVFSAHGNNFVKTMLRLGKDREELGVVADQLGKPASAKEIARVIYEVLASNRQAWGTYHLAQPAVTSWHGFAESIFAEAKAQDLPLNIQKVNAITTEDYPTPAKRPANSELGCEKLENTFGLNLNTWQASLKEVIEELKDE